MTIPPEGILLVITCGIGYWLAWKTHFHHKWTVALTLLIVVGLLLRLYTSTDMYLHFWDERYHALVAKNLISHPLTPTLYDTPILGYDYQNWAGSHVWLHKQPLPLWTMAASIWTFGNNELALRLPSLLLALLGIYLIYRIGKQLFGFRVGFFAAFLFSVNGMIIEIGSGRVATDHIDLFFLIFVLLAVFFAVQFADKGKQIFNISCGIAIGCAILCKWLPALIVLPIWGLLLLHARTFSFKQVFLNGVLLLLTIFIVAAPWQFYIYSNFPLEAAWEASFNHKHFTEPLEGQGKPVMYHFITMQIVYAEIVYLPLLWFFYQCIKKRTNWKYWVLALWILVPYIVFSFAHTKMQGYTMFTAPAIFIVCGLFWSYLKSNYRRFRYKWIIAIVLFLMIALPIRFGIDRVKPFHQTDRTPEWSEDIKHFAEIADTVNRPVIFNVENPIEIMFYSKAVAYEYIPSQPILDSLIRDGHTVFMNSNDLSKEFYYPDIAYIFLHSAGY
jgi:4-amino-4-deoxy-L-arabinose transferase-like glycosyltransferase